MTNVIMRRLLYIAAPVFALLILVGLVGRIYAQQASQVTLAYTPQVIEFSANPGDPTYENVIRLTNGSDVPLEIDSTPVNFLAGGEEGEPELTEETTAFSLSQWITVTPESYSLAPGESQDFLVEINVPADAEPGGHFGGVQFTGVPPVPAETSDNFVSQEFNVTPLILVSVAGDITEGANIESFGSTQSMWTDWSDENPITLETRIYNSGNVHFKPKGTITIKNMFGREVTTIPLTESNVLPDSIRKITSEWSDPGFQVGRFTAEVSFVYGSQSEILSAETSFIIFPYKTIVPIAVVTIFVLFILIRFRSRIGMALKVLSGKG